MKVLINIIIFIVDLVIALFIIGLVIYCEYKLIFTNLYPILGEEYSEWLVLFLLGIAGITFYILAKLNARILVYIGTKYCQANKINNTAISVNINNKFDRNKTNDLLPIISKPLGGYRREQLNEIYLLGILLHQLYYSAAGNNFSESQQKKALNIQMRFFITVFPQRNINEYFDFTEAFMTKNEAISHYSVLEGLERSMKILSTCNGKQIRKLQNLYNTLYNSYIEIGGGNKTVLNTYVKMIDAELSGLIPEEDWRDHYTKKKIR